MLDTMVGAGISLFCVGPRLVETSSEAHSSVAGERVLDSSGCPQWKCQACMWDPMGTWNSC